MDGLLALPLTKTGIGVLVGLPSSEDYELLPDRPYDRTTPQRSCPQISFGKAFLRQPLTASGQELLRQIESYGFAPQLHGGEKSSAATTKRIQDSSASGARAGDSGYHEILGKGSRVVVLTGSNAAAYNIVGLRLRRVQLVIVLRPSFLGALDEVEKVLVRQPQSVLLRTRRNVGFVPDQIVAQDPPTILHGNRKARRDKQQLLLLPISSHRRTAPEAILIPQPLPATVSDAGPAGKVGVPQVDPDAALGLQGPACSLEDLHQVVDVPIRTGFETKDSAMAAVPGVRRRNLDRSAFSAPVLEDLPVVGQTIAAVTPIRRAGNEEVDTRMRQESEQVEGIALAEKPVTILDLRAELRSKRLQSCVVEQVLRDDFIAGNSARFQGVGHARILAGGDSNTNQLGLRIASQSCYDLQSASDGGLAL